jgi:hypothetical protein
VLEAVLKAVASFCPEASTVCCKVELAASVDRLEMLENRADISVPMSVVEVVKVGSIACNDVNCALAPL